MSKNFLKLGACMLADAALTIATGGIYLITRDSYNTSFTEDELYHQRRKENFEIAIDAYKKLTEKSKDE